MVSAREASPDSVPRAHRATGPAILPLTVSVPSLTVVTPVWFRDMLKVAVPCIDFHREVSPAMVPSPSNV